MRILPSFPLPGRDAISGKLMLLSRELNFISTPQIAFRTIMIINLVVIVALHVNSRFNLTFRADAGDYVQACTNISCYI